MDVLNEEEAMFESALVDSYLTSPVTVSPPACYSTHSCRNQQRIVLRGLVLARFPSCRLLKHRRCLRACVCLRFRKESSQERW